MSLRSGSPCTSTSRPSSSCSLITSAISDCIRRVYSASSISPATSAARALRISTFGGRTPLAATGSRDRLEALTYLAVVQPRVLLAGGNGRVGLRDLVGHRV